MPVLRPMAVEFPDDPACSHLDRQYMLGDRLLVAPVFSASGETSYYIPAGTWTSLLTGAAVRGPRWVSEVCDFSTLPVYVRPGSVLPMGSRDDRPDYGYDEDVTLRAYELGNGDRVVVTVPGPHGEVAAEFEVARDAGTLTAIRRRGTAGWRLASGPDDAGTAVPADTDNCSVRL
jgi:alpha-D-xyloside xylohydrolase